MGPNDAELVRVWTREVGGTIGDETFPHNAAFEVVVEAEAGLAIFNSGAQFQTGLVVRDLYDNTFITVGPPNSFNGSLNSPAWATRAKQFVYTVPAASLGNARLNHVCEVVAHLVIGVATPDVSFAVSPMFIITAP